MSHAVFYTYTEDEGNVASELIAICTSIESAQKIIADLVAAKGQYWLRIGSIVGIEENYTQICTRREQKLPCTLRFGSFNGFVIEEITLDTLSPGPNVPI